MLMAQIGRVYKRPTFGDYHIVLAVEGARALTLHVDPELVRTWLDSVPFSTAYIEVPWYAIVPTLERMDEFYRRGALMNLFRSSPQRTR